MDATAFIRWFRESSPYIKAHQGQTFVVLLHGEAIADAGFADLGHDLALMSSLGIRLVLVHGARPQIEAALAERGIETRIVNGLRVTDGEALTCIKEAAGRIRVEIEAVLSMTSANAISRAKRLDVAGGNLVTARPLGILDGIDFMYTGQVRRVDAAAIGRLLDGGSVVVVSPLGYSATGEVFSLHADEVAAAVAEEIRADKLIILDEDGGLAQVDGQPVRELTLAQARDYLGEWKNTAGAGVRAVLQLEHAVHACRHGVARVHIIDRATDGGLLRELFTRDGAGTLISTGPFDTVRKANIDDIGGILDLIVPLEEQGSLVRRSRDKLEMEVDRFTVLERDGTVIACAALYPYPEEGMAELACLAVHDGYAGGGRGGELLEHLVREARQAGLGRIFVLTTQAAHWFQERGFAAAELDDLPVARQSLYNYQRNSRAFVREP